MGVFAGVDEDPGGGLIVNDGFGGEVISAGGERNVLLNIDGEVKFWALELGGLDTAWVYLFWFVMDAQVGIGKGKIDIWGGFWEWHWILQSHIEVS